MRIDAMCRARALPSNLLYFSNIIIVLVLWWLDEPIELLAPADIINKQRDIHIVRAINNEIIKSIETVVATSITINLDIYRNILTCRCEFQCYDFILYSTRHYWKALSRATRASSIR